MVTRTALLAVVCVLILGGAWLFSGSARQRDGAVQGPAPADKPARAPTGSKPAGATNGPSVASAEPSKPPEDSKEPNPGEGEPTKPADSKVPDAVEPAEKKIPNPVAGEANKPPKDAKPPHLIEVDLSKLPPDLVKQIQGAIVERRKPKAEPKPAP
jgi:hypothetical protein